MASTRPEVQLEVTEGPIAGKIFSFEDYDTLIFGRSRDCHARLPADDGTVSRHHFLLEVNPPDARLRDLGSLNGTFVNEVRYGGRAPMVDPTDVSGAEVDLSDGDVIRVGASVFKLHVIEPPTCSDCGAAISRILERACRVSDGTFVCPTCRGRRERSSSTLPPRSTAISRRCDECGRDVSVERSRGRPGHYLCGSCRANWTQDPKRALRKLGERDAVTRRNSEIVERLSGYELLEELGRGSAGCVYRARSTTSDREVAVKLLFAKVAVSDYTRSAFLREIDVTKQLRHTNIVELIDHGSEGSVFFSVMELCPGGSLFQLKEQRGGKVPLDEALPIFMQALEGLAYAHAKGFVHRDIQPANILLSRPGGMAKIADFGLAKSFVEIGLDSLTLTGRTAGTLKYMPYEQLVDFKNVRPVSDVWSLATTMYFLLTDTYPRDVGTMDDPVGGILSGAAVSIRERDPQIPTPVAEVIDRALALKVKDRYATAGEFRRALSSVL